MTRDAKSRIVAWFTEHNGDGEFVRLPATHPYSLTVRSSETRLILYTTKPASVLYVLEQSGGLRTIQVIGRAGLPPEEDVEWLQTVAHDLPLFFLGDSDPPDLLILAWLRLQMAVSYAGVSDSLIHKLNLRIEDHLTIPLAETERAAVPLLAAICPDFEQLMGSECAKTLIRGRKIEIEAVILGHDHHFEDAIIQ